MVGAQARIFCQQIKCRMPGSIVLQFFSSVRALSYLKWDAVLPKQSVEGTYMACEIIMTSSTGQGVKGETHEWDGGREILLIQSAFYLIMLGIHLLCGLPWLSQTTWIIGLIGCWIIVPRDGTIDIFALIMEIMLNLMFFDTWFDWWLCVGNARNFNWTAQVEALLDRSPLALLNRLQGCVFFYGNINENLMANHYHTCPFSYLDSFAASYSDLHKVFFYWMILFHAIKRP